LYKIDIAQVIDKDEAKINTEQSAVDRESVKQRPV